MPQLPIPQHWQDRIFSLLSQNPGGITDNAIFRTLKGEAAHLMDGHDVDGHGVASRYPSSRTITRYRGDWEKMSQEKKAQYRLFRWPDSMELGDLPWEASPSGLQLLAFLDLHGVRERPPIRLVKWFWRVTQAAGNAGILKRLFIASELHREESKMGLIGSKGIEWFLAYHQLAENGRLEAYMKAVNREDEPIEPISAGLAVSVDDLEEFDFWKQVLKSIGVDGVRRAMKDMSDEKGGQ